MRSGVILKGIGGFYDVLSEQEIIRCRVRGRFRKMGITPMVGDRVVFKPASDVSEGAVEEILPRKNELVRPAVANIDHLAVVMAATNPEPDLLLVDKLLISAELNHIAPLLVINKVDLVSEEELQRFEEEYRSAGCPIYKLSGKFGIGIDALSRGLQGITTLAGQSGAGKSSIINRLHPPLSLETGNISEKLKRGKHTTRHVELLLLPYGGMIVDTPGFSQMDLSHLDPETLQRSYKDFLPYMEACRFHGCLHRHEPQCAVQQAVEEGRIPRGRYERYLRLLDEIAANRRDEW